MIDHDCSYEGIGVRKGFEKETDIFKVGEDSIEGWHKWAINKKISAVVEDLKCKICGGTHLLVLQADRRYAKEVV
jgi:hypothetical protein